MSRSYQSNWESVGSSTDPDVLYYNASIVNNNTDDLINGFAYRDPLVKFNETRDKSIVRDASLYQFSIVRFVVNGGNLDLPLFIPNIQSSTGQFNPNLTEYGLGITLSIRLVNGDTTQTTYNICPPLTYVIHVPENENVVQAPPPAPPCSPDFVFTVNGGVWQIGNAYAKGNIITPDNTYTLYLQAQIDVPPGTPLNGTYTVGGMTMPYWVSVSPELGRPQDVSTRYYWINNFQHMVDMVNTALVAANTALFNGLLTAWLANGSGNTTANFPYVTGAGVPSYEIFAESYPAPIMTYSIPSGLFSITYPSVYLNPVPLSGAPIKIGLWMNTNLAGLFANFLSVYYNKPAGDGSLGASLFGQGAFLPGYAYRMTVEYVNLGANRVLNSAIIPTPVYNGGLAGGDWVQMTQEYISTSTLWSPIESLVFISNLLPLQNEQTAPPNTYGMGNIGNSTTVSQSAFQPIITDVANSLGTDPLAWRKMLYYAPTAEYRMADFQNSKSEIKNIDVQVFWKNRLNNELYPLSMYNLSSVSIKIMFRKKNALVNTSKSEKVGIY